MNFYGTKISRTKYGKVQIRLVEFSRAQNPLAYVHIWQQYPTDPFASLELQNPLHDVPEQYEINTGIYKLFLTQPNLCQIA